MVLKFDLKNVFQQIKLLICPIFNTEENLDQSFVHLTFNSQDRKRLQMWGNAGKVGKYKHNQKNVLIIDNFLGNY